MKPLVSVVMPVFNAEAFLRAAVESILTQTVPELELLACDDGSTDRTRAMLESYARADSRVKVISRNNAGPAKSANELLHHAQGDFIAPMDADDVSLPERLAKQLRFLRDHPSVVCVGGSVDLIDEKSRYLTSLRYLTDDSDIQRQALAGHGTICHPAALIRREAMSRIGGYSTAYRYAHDLDLWLRLGEIGELANLPDVILQYRLHGRSFSERYRDAQRDDARRACEHAWARRGISGTYEATMPWRPGPGAASRHEFMLRYGWWAYGSRQRRTALIYGVRAIRALPFAQEGWKLLLCGLCRPFSKENAAR